MAVLRFDPDLVQAVVDAEVARAAASGNKDLLRNYHSLTEPVYINVAPDDREVAFRKIHQVFFDQLGLPALLHELWQETPALEADAPSWLIIPASRKHEEGAVIGRDGKSVCLRLQPARLLDRAHLAVYVRHELLHAADMLDPAFGYQVTFRNSWSETNRLAERYRAIWCASIDARVTANARAPLRPLQARRGEIDEAFALLDKERRDALWQAIMQPSGLNHNRILELAQWVDAEPADERPLPGARCPLCRFTTYNWAGALSPRVEALIRRDFPNWSPAQGTCDRCAERYAMLAPAGGDMPRYSESGVTHSRRMEFK